MRFWLVLPRPGLRDVRHETHGEDISIFHIYLGREIFIDDIQNIRTYTKSTMIGGQSIMNCARKWLKDTKQEAKSVRHSANHIHKQVQTNQSKLKVTHGEKKRNLDLTGRSDDPIIHDFHDFYFFLSWQFGEVIICADCSRSIDRRSIYYPPVFHSRTIWTSTIGHESL